MHSIARSMAISTILSNSISIKVPIPLEDFVFRAIVPSNASRNPDSHNRTTPKIGFQTHATIAAISPIIKAIIVT
ncbi:hypothetical protein SDC9_179788 [bioreactor metagenome]|uniref:Uncharacterized protein n=1 Tax=bioreactor metagenome TaxID=1076179 RepID=A0A645H0U4_9ZZZZ